jgi:hypothetical protein
LTKLIKERLVKEYRCCRASANDSCHIGEPTEPPTLSPARGPPFFQTRVVRRKLGEPDADARQQEMFSI